MGLLELPSEIILLVYQGLNLTSDAYYFSQSCKYAYNVFSVPHNRGKILRSILNNMLSAAAPNRAWLEACFGANTLWRPTDNPVGLDHDRTREFLLNVGFPAFKIHGIPFESTHLAQHANNSLKHYVLTDENELEMHHTPSCPLAQCTDIYFHFGTVNGCMVMVDGVDGDVWLYEPDYHPYAGAHFYIYDCPWRNTVAWSLDSLAMLLGMVAAVVQDLRDASWKSASWGSEARKCILDLLREHINGCDYVVAEDISGFWGDLFKNLMEE
ncbi:SUKH-4 immunity protein-domain-containing protein, partial [Aspergillus pseudonomiae]|uniref:SUKH-4 immunity protein-domain-containing protein n=1 Tax=Aspergillus pseudonomiae TaxID=1506151 RepID=A0A5N7D7J9_9EURO